MNRCVRYSALWAAACIGQMSFAQSMIDKLPPEFRVKHTNGDSVQPTYEGWRRHPDGSITMYFGYYNRNTEERVNVPIGENNMFDMAGDSGQPAYFYPGYHQFVFKVDLPKGWPDDKKIVWSLRSNGVSLTANGWTAPGYEVDEGVMAMNLSSPGGNAENNIPPVVTGPDDQTVAAGTLLPLSFSATDDGIPAPRPGRSGGGVQLRIEEYRGSGDVEFFPPSATGEYGKGTTLTTSAKFSKPGVYLLRAIGFDTQLEGSHDVKVTVK